MLDNLIVCLEAVFPIFALLLVGYVTKRLGMLNREDVARMNGAVYRVFMPAMVFYNLYTSDLDTAIRPGLVAYALIAVLLVTGASLLLVIRTEPVRKRRGVIVQALYRSNLVIIGVPVVERLMGAENLGPVVFLMATVVPLFNVMAVVLLEYYGGEKTQPGRLLLDILKNPLIVGSLAGILALLLKLKLPSPLEVLVRQMANANSPILIFLLGVFLQVDGLRGDWKAVSLVSLGRLVFVPMLTLIPAALLGFRGVELASLIPVFASSAAVGSFTMAQQMGGDAELAGNVVVVTSALCPLTMFFWCFLFKSLGMI